MKTKFILPVLVASLLYFELEAQQSSSFYYYNGKKIPLSISDNKFYVENDKLGLKFDTLKFSVKSKATGMIVTGKNKSIDCKTELEKLKRDKKVSSIQPVVDNGKEIPISGEFYVRLKYEKDTTELKKLVVENVCSNLQKVDLMPFWYSIKTSIASKRNALAMANYFYETGLFARVDPGFMLDLKPNCSTEPKFNEQWGLNTAVAGEYDINICQAWTITKGSSSVLVAVYDSGIDTVGSEFTGRLHNKAFCSQYLFNYPFYNSGWSEHGTNVASVIAANENNSQLVGVAPNVKLMNVTHSFGYVENATTHHAKGISWAWRNGAHIINNSWGDSGGSEYESLKSEILEDAIDSALVHGRGGLGTILVFSAGNYNNNFVEYPGSYSPEILVVGASNRQSQRTLFPTLGTGSSYGTGLDLIAPGRDIPVVSKGNVYSIVNGTSFAAPHVAGVAALILSIAPNLTRQEVVNIIEKTAQKTGGYNYQTNAGHPNGTWNQEVGHGLLDAYAALQLANCNTTLYINNTNYTGTNNQVKACKVEFNNSTVTNGSKLNVLIGKEATLNGGFEVQLGAELDIK